MSEQLERSKIAELTTEIVAAYGSYHQIRPTDVPNIINLDFLGFEWWA